MIVFKAHVKLNKGTNLEIVPGGRRFSPNLQFALPELDDVRFGLTVMEPELAISSGMEGTCRFRMVGDPEFALLAKLIEPGVEFKLSQGPIPLGTGTVRDVKERGLH